MGLEKKCVADNGMAFGNAAGDFFVLDGAADERCGRTGRWLLFSDHWVLSGGMAVAFFFIAALLNGVFEVHGRITGRFVLQEAMEWCLYREEKTLRGDGMTVGEISSRAGQRLHGFFRCGDAVLTIREDGGDLDGRVKSSTETEISLRGQEPERAIRLLTVLENAE